MDTIIDGYNLIFSMGWKTAKTSTALERSRNRLIAELSQRIDQTQRSGITIVFDAKNRPIKDVESEIVQNGFRILFASQYDEADALIEELIAGHSTPKTLTVVSNDLRLQTAAKRRKSMALGCEPWLDRIESSRDDQDASSTLPEPRGSKDVQIEGLKSTDWIEEFQIDNVDDLDSSRSTGNDSGDGDVREIYNPFPPGYGEDLTE